jgi:hypothetical protein
MNTDPSTPPRPRRPSQFRLVYRIGRAVLVAAVLGAVGMFVVQLVLRHLADREVNEAVAEVDRTDPGWTFDEIQAHRKNLPDEQNGARRVVAAFALLPRPWPAWGNPAFAEQFGLDEDDQKYFDDPSWQRDPRLLPQGKRLASLRSELKRAEAAVKEALTLEQFPDGRYEIDWKLDMLNTLLRDTQNSRDVVLLLDLDAVRRICDRDVEGACRNVRAALNIARSHGDEISVIALLVRIAEGSVAVGMLERVLAQGTPSANALRSLQKALEGESEDIARGTLGAVHGERALFHRM